MTTNHLKKPLDSTAYKTKAEQGLLRAQLSSRNCGERHEKWGTLPLSPESHNRIEKARETYKATHEADLEVYLSAVFS